MAIQSDQPAKQQYQNFRIVHQIKRRVRIIAPALIKDSERCFILEILLRKRNEITQVNGSPQIGSFAIRFDPDHLPATNLLMMLDTILENIGKRSAQSFQSAHTIDTSQPPQEYTFSIEGMTCSSCALLISMILNRDPRIRNADVNFATETVNLHGWLSADDAKTLIAKAGYTAHPANTLSQRKQQIDRDEKRLKTSWKAVKWSGLLSAPVVVLGMAFANTPVLRAVQLILTTPVVFWHGRQFFTKAWRLAGMKTANMDSLIALGVGSAYGYSVVSMVRGNRHLYFEAAAAIVSFVLLGRYLEERAKGKAGEAIRKLVDLQPQTAIRIEHGQETVVDVDDIEVGDQLLIRPGARMPTDGKVIEGLSTVDESMVTGESMPVIKDVNHGVVGGCINGEGRLIMEVSAVGADTVLARIVHMVGEAQASKLPIQKTVDSISSVFVPSVMVISGLTFTGWLVVGAPFSIAFANAITVLLIACPCALGLATPAAIMVGTGQAAQRGIYIRNGESLETAANITAVVFDKTGTITEGKPKVDDLINISRLSPTKVIQLAASAEVNSEHSLGQAIVNYARNNDITPGRMDDFVSKPGRGIRARKGSHTIILGNEAWMREQHIDLQQLPNHAMKLAEQSKTPVYMAIDGEEAALFGIADLPRKTAQQTIKRLQQMHVKTCMLTGDIEQTANNIARQVGINEVISEADPEQKLTVIRHMQEQGEIVGMIGDGVNDAPALAAADVGLAIGSGTDIAIETADLTLVQGDIAKVADAIEISSNTISIIRQNLFWAFGYNVIALPVAALGRLNPMIASGAMALSSISVVLNSLRLARKNKEDSL